MQFAGLYYVFITATMYTGGGELEEKNCARCLRHKTRVVLKTSGTVCFTIRTYLGR